MTTGINVDKLQTGLRTKGFAKHIVFLHRVNSTNDVAKQLAEYGAKEGTVVIAETQTAGRGRLGRKWSSPEGGLYFSIILRPRASASEAVKLVFVAGLVVAEVLKGAYQLCVETKWPNDVLVNQKKICGILSEMNVKDKKVNFVVVGVGINVNIHVSTGFPASLKETATSIKDELGRNVSLEELFRALLEEFESTYTSFAREGFTQMLDKWKKYAGFLGREVEVKSGTERLHGVALDVRNDGSLVLKCDDKSIRVVTGDMSALS